MVATALLGHRFQRIAARPCTWNWCVLRVSPPSDLRPVSGGERFVDVAAPETSPDLPRVATTGLHKGSILLDVPAAAASEDGAAKNAHGRSLRGPGQAT